MARIEMAHTKGTYKIAHTKIAYTKMAFTNMAHKNDIF